MKITLLKTSFLTLALASALLASLPAHDAHAQAAAATASQTSASKLVLDSSTRILGTLEQRRAEFRKNPAALKQFITGEFNRMFDRDYAARLVLGRHSRGAAPADVTAFANALTDNLMQRYGAALLGFDGKPRIRLKGESPLPNNRGVKVSTEILREGGDPIPVDYYVRNNGGWKIFDVMVEGVSYVQTFRSQFDAPLKRASIAQVAADLQAGKLKADAR